MCVYIYTYIDKDKIMIWTISKCINYILYLPILLDLMKLGVCIQKLMQLIEPIRVLCGEYEYEYVYVYV